jgi:hypothetical protein
MTSREHLQKHLQKSVELFGENDPSTLDLKRQLQDMEQEELSDQSPQMLQFQAGFRKAKEFKRPKA